MKHQKHLSNKLILLWIIIFTVILGVIIFFYIFSVKPVVVKSFVSNLESEKVDLVVDGDTFSTSNGTYVRLICIDSPEVGKPGYLEAKNYLTSLILNKTVRVEKDVSNTDKYGRLLRYVYLEDGTFVNREIVKAGHADVWVYEPDTKKCEEIRG